MKELSILAQVVIAAGIVNVWVLRYSRPTPWRPDGARNMEEEFRRYGLPDWLRTWTGAAKLGLAALLVAGIWYAPLAAAAGLAMAALMLGALVAHLRIADQPRKFLPALSLFALSLFVGLTNAAG